MTWFNKVEEEVLDQEDGIYLEYYNQLSTRSTDCDSLLRQIDKSLNSLTDLTNEYNFVSNKTSSLHTASEKLIEEQNKLNEITAELKKRLHYFNQVESLSQRLQSPTLSVSSEAFVEILNKIDECLQYLRSNVSLLLFNYSFL